MVSFVSFPDLSNANEDGLLAMGGDLNVDTLVSAYAQGIFPWFNDNQPILWWSPDPRMVLFPTELKISKSLAKLSRKKRYRLSCNRVFSQVIQRCALRGSTESMQSTNSTWITDDMREAYQALHEDGYAHSIEVWNEQQLVGGLYGVALGKVFFGESMFSAENNTSKLALVALCNHLQTNGYHAIDCQVSSDHLLSLGAQEVARDDFMEYLTDIDIQKAAPNFADGFTF